MCRIELIRSVQLSGDKHGGMLQNKKLKYQAIISAITTFENPSSQKNYIQYNHSWYNTVKLHMIRHRHFGSPSLCDNRKSANFKPKSLTYIIGKYISPSVSCV